MRAITKRAREAQLRLEFLSPDFGSWISTNASWADPKQFQLQAFGLLLPSDAPILFEMFDNADLTKRARISAGLAWLRWTNAVPRLIHEVTTKHKGQILGPDDLLALSQIIQHLGFHARVSDEAWSFLVKGIRPSFWKTAIQWSEEGAGTNIAGSVSLCCSECMVAIGAAARPGSIAILRGLASNSDLSFLSNYSGSIVEGARSYDLSSEGGDAFVLKCLTKNGTMIESRSWASSVGAGWLEWNQKAMRKIPALPPDWHTPTNAP